MTHYVNMDESEDFFDASDRLYEEWKDRMNQKVIEQSDDNSDEIIILRTQRYDVASEVYSRLFSYGLYPCSMNQKASLGSVWTVSIHIPKGEPNAEGNKAKG